MLLGNAQHLRGLILARLGQALLLDLGTGLGRLQVYVRRRARRGEAGPVLTRTQAITI